MIERDFCPNAVKKLIFQELEPVIIVPMAWDSKMGLSKTTKLSKRKYYIPTIYLLTSGQNFFLKSHSYVFSNLWYYINICMSSGAVF